MWYTPRVIPLAYSLISVILVSLISFIGVSVIALTEARLNKLLIYLVSFSAGALFGDVFIHLLPEFIEENGFDLYASFGVLAGIGSFFVLEKIVHWHHHHEIECENRPKPFAIVNLVGDGFHNLLDGVIIAGSYLFSIPVGIATTLAVILHEIPQEIGDFGILLYGGFKVRQALWFNFLTALSAVVGAVLVFILVGYVDGIESILIPYAAGGFLYVAGSDLIPELHKHTGLKTSLAQLAALMLGIAVMLGLLLIAE